MSEDAIATLCAHVRRTSYEDLPDDAVDAARRFILDSLGVAVSGSRGPHTDDLYAAALASTGEGECRIPGTGWRLPAAPAASLIAYQIHNAEFDCVHEAAVVHPMAVLLGAVMAYAERERATIGRRISGRDLLLAVCLGVDVGAGIGVASRSALSFFRPATAGAFAAAAALGKLEGLDQDELVGLMGLILGQLGGTMQAHTEGSVMLAMQVGFNARNALWALDLARSGIKGPREVLEGPYGYYPLFEGQHDLPAMLGELGRVWRITEVAYKPFPSGRATHGIVDACLILAARHQLRAEAVLAVEAVVPSLTHRLVGRPVHGQMEPNYARLCAAYVAARALIRGRVDLDDFSEAARVDPVTLELASRVAISIDDNPDPNALAPITVRIIARDGTRVEQELDVIYGNPAKPMTREAWVDKFERNLGAARVRLPSGAANRALSLLESLPEQSDIGVIFDELCPPNPRPHPEQPAVAQ